MVTGEMDIDAGVIIRCCKRAVLSGSKQCKHDGCCCTCGSQSWFW